MIAQAAAIAATLAEAGMPAAAIHHWFDQPRRELANFAPHELLVEVGAPAGARVLELARHDALEVLRCG